MAGNDSFEKEIMLFVETLLPNVQVCQADEMLHPLLILMKLAHRVSHSTFYLTISNVFLISCANPSKLWKQSGLNGFRGIWVSTNHKPVFGISSGFEAFDLLARRKSSHSLLYKSILAGCFVDLYFLCIIYQSFPLPKQIKIHLFSHRPIGVFQIPCPKQDGLYTRSARLPASTISNGCGWHQASGKMETHGHRFQQSQCAV